MKYVYETQHVPVIGDSKPEFDLPGDATGIASLVVGPYRVVGYLRPVAGEPRTLALSVDDLKEAAAWMADEGIESEYRRLVEEDPDVTGGLSPSDWLLLPYVLDYLGDEDRGMAEQLLAGLTTQPD